MIHTASPLSRRLVYRAIRSLNRAQRASARSLNAAPTPIATPPLGDEPVASSSHAADGPTEPNGVPPPPEDERHAFSRANSDMNVDEPDAGSASARGRGARNKGKAKEKAPLVRVKEEPVTVSLSMLDPVVPRQVRSSSWPCGTQLMGSCSRMTITALLVAQLRLVVA